MSIRIKHWNRFGATLALSAAGMGLITTAATVTPADAKPQAASTMDTHAKHAGHGESEGEGKSAAVAESEGEGEGEGSSSALSLATDDSAYLAHLGQVRGHLKVGVALYEAGAYEMAISHMKHPGDELYTAIKPALAARKAADFADALSTLAKAVESKADLAQVRQAHDALEKAIEASQSVVDSQAANHAVTVYATVLKLVRTAADEYAIGVKQGKIVNAHEYQDAWGFTTIAKQWLESLTEQQRTGSIDTYEKIARQVDALLASAWPAVVPPETVTGDAADLYGAAARIELAYLAASRKK